MIGQQKPQFLASGQFPANNQSEDYADEFEAANYEEEYSLEQSQGSS